MEQNPRNQQDPYQDNWNNSNTVGDSTAMTIEFLRARLLAERSVSRTARQRADELAKRVVELEEQLKVVSLQRKKAEKATADVLAILENQGVSDFSEEFDSSSDQETTHFESKMGNNLPEEESSAGLKMEGNNMDDVSGSELETCSLPVRCLSWKSGKDSLSSSREKYTDSSSRRRSSFTSTSFSSPRQSAGKSCRRIRQRDMRSAITKAHINECMPAPQENGDAAFAGGCLACSYGAPDTIGKNSENQDHKNSVEGSGDLETRQSYSITNSHLEVLRSDKDMERALEHQAQLIGKYEEEENAQREWEEKFGESNSPQDSCEPGTTHSNITEEREESKADFPQHPVCSIVSIDLIAKQSVEDAHVTKESSTGSSNGSQHPVSPPQPEMEYFQGREKSSTVLVSPSKGDNTSGSKPESHKLIPREGPDEVGSVLEALQQAKLSLIHKLNALPPTNGDLPGKAIEWPLLNRGFPSNAIEFPLSSGGSPRKASELPSLNSGSPGKAIEFPAKGRPEVFIECDGLFRVPSDFYPENITRNNNVLALKSGLSVANYADRLNGTTQKYSVPSSTSRLSMTNYADHMDGITQNNNVLASNSTMSLSSYPEQFMASTSTSPYMDGSRSRVARESIDTWPRVPFSEPPPWSCSDTGFPYPKNNVSNDLNINRVFRSSLDIGIPYPNLYVHNGRSKDTNHVSSSNASPTYPLYSDPMLRMPPSGDRIFPSTGTGVVCSDFSFYDHVKPNMYRQ